MRSLPNLVIHPLSILMSRQITKDPTRPTLKLTAPVSDVGDYPHSATLTVWGYQWPEHQRWRTRGPDRMFHRRILSLQCIARH